MPAWPKDVIWKSNQEYSSARRAKTIAGGYLHLGNPQAQIEAQIRRQARDLLGKYKRQGVQAPKHIYEVAGLPVPPKPTLGERWDAWQKRRRA